MGFELIGFAVGRDIRSPVAEITFHSCISVIRWLACCPRHASGSPQPAATAKQCPAFEKVARGGTPAVFVGFGSVVSYPLDPLRYAYPAISSFVSVVLLAKL